MENKQSAQSEQIKHSNPCVRRVAVVVGASSGIGRETALALCARGYKVYNLSRTPFQGEKVVSVSVDVAQEGELQSAVEALGEEHIDLFVYSAGYSLAAPVEFANAGDYRYLFEVNYFGAVEGIRAVFPKMEKRGGRIILVGSLGGLFPIPFDGFYSASKAALSMLAREADMEFRSRNVRVSVLHPGGTATDFTYRRKIYEENRTLQYSAEVKKASAALANLEQGGAAAQQVAEDIVRLAEKRNPPQVAVSGVGNIALAAAQRLLPERTVDYFVRKKFNQK